MFNKSSPRSRLAALALGVVVVLGLQVTQAIPAQAAGGPSCRQITVPVTLSPSDSTVYHVTGWLCANGSPAGKTLQVLTHGLTYDHRYWDWSQSPQTYSYIRKATDAGYATFAYDRIGSGMSDHPVNGNNVTLQAAGFVLHQLVQGFRSGSIGGPTFSRVVSVGHSLGSNIAVVEAKYHDVDGIILSTFAHQPAPPAFELIQTDIYPAPLDPAFANSGLNDTYLTTMPGTRGQFFFNPANTSADVISLDEDIKQTGTTGELNPDPDAFATLEITVPILLAMGQDDALYCDPTLGLPCTDEDTFLAREGSNFNQSCLEAFVLADSGHDLNLHNNAHLWFEAAADWVGRRVGSDATHPATQPC